MIIAAQVISAAGDFWLVQNCAKLLDVIGDPQQLVDQYPSCASLVETGNQQAVAAVNAQFGGTVVELMSALNISFGMAGWLALGLHALGVEVYVSALFERCRQQHLLTIYSCTSLLPNQSVFARLATSDD